MTALAQSSPDRPSTSTGHRDVHVWEAAVRRVLRPDRVELVDGSPRQRHRLTARAVRHGTLDPSSVALGTRYSWDDDAAPPARGSGAQDDEELLRAEVVRRSTGASRGRPLWLAPRAERPSSSATPSPGEVRPPARWWCARRRALPLGSTTR